MPMHRVITGFVCFIAAILLSAFLMEPVERWNLIYLAIGMVAGAGIFSFSFGLATMASTAAQRAIMGEIMLANQKPSKPADVTIFKGKADSIITKSTE